MITELIGIAGALVIVASAVGNFTTLSAITQMGSVQERDSPWAGMSKRFKSAASKGGTSIAAASAKTVSMVTPTLKPDQSPSELLHSVRTKDKIIYTLGVANMGFTCYLFGAYPEYFYLWHTPKAIFYTAHRWYTFKQQKQHYLLYDFCYWANGLSLLYCWVFPNSATMFQILFIVANGPLAWAVLAFSQSMIFHSAPHMTSVFIHTSPMVLSHALRWQQPEGFTVCDGDCSEVSSYDLVWNAVFKFYGWWVVIYYVWVYVIFGNRIKSRGYKTLFDRVIQKGPTKFIVKLSSNDLVQKAAYMVTHFVFALFTMVLATIYWHSKIAHWVFALAIVCTSAWNAAGFYFTVFAAKYEEDLRAKAGMPVDK